VLAGSLAQNKMRAAVDLRDRAVLRWAWPCS
jgi:hypothetical protein